MAIQAALNTFIWLLKEIWPDLEIKKFHDFLENQNMEIQQSSFS